jgi:hypothetical protein
MYLKKKHNINKLTITEKEPCFYFFPYPMETEQHELLEKRPHLQNPKNNTTLIER